MENVLKHLKSMLPLPVALWFRNLANREVTKSHPKVDDDIEKFQYTDFTNE